MLNTHLNKIQNENFHNEFLSTKKMEYGISTWTNILRHCYGIMCSLTMLRNHQTKMAKVRKPQNNKQLKGAIISTSNMFTPT